MNSWEEALAYGLLIGPILVVVLMVSNWIRGKLTPSNRKTGNRGTQ